MEIINFHIEYKEGLDLYRRSNEIQSNTWTCGLQIDLPSNRILTIRYPTMGQHATLRITSEDDRVWSVHLMFEDHSTVQTYIKANDVEHILPWVSSQLARFFG